MSRINTILVANRGEIACRILRTIQSMGLRGIAVYSEADTDAPHTKMADQAVCIGPSPVGQSYLKGDVIIAAALKMGADAIHPGYGFLSENTDFADACQKAGITFIGPSAEAIQIMGNKAESKRRMLEADIPCIPGYEGHDQSEELLIDEGLKVGFPLMVKAAAGGGGRGMRLVKSQADLASAIERARSEAENAFGSGELILEKAVIDPRHVEIQILGDTYGTILHLGERDCSVQRRHQKVLEESPCPVMYPELREKMGCAATQVAAAVDYVGAGTVEFLLDADDNFYFLEMNTRLQVEHPVTELVTDIDLVEWQIRIAEGGRLDIKQEEIELKGHAIEARLYAEDPEQDFLPMTGQIELWKAASGEGVRIDAGIESGQEISPFYDAMVAKIVAHGPSRDIARRRLVTALKNTVLFGPKTNKSFLIACLEKGVFADGQATTAFIENEIDLQSNPNEAPSELNAVIASVLRYNFDCKKALENAVLCSPSLTGWSSGYRALSRYQYELNGGEVELTVQPAGDEQFHVQCANMDHRIELLSVEADCATLIVDEQRHTVFYKISASNGIWLSIDGNDLLYTNILTTNTSSEEAVSSGHIAAPMHGVVQEICVSLGDTIQKGQNLLVLEAMKMQHEIPAPISGVVEEIRVKSGVQVVSDELLLILQEEAS